MVLAAGEEKEVARIRAIKLLLAEKEVKSRPKPRALPAIPRGKMTSEQQMAHRWYLATALASRLALVKEFLIEKHKMVGLSMLQEQSACIVQRRWRLFSNNKRQVVVDGALVIIRRLALRFVRKRREKARHHAADILRMALTDGISLSS
jgi:hypothetical protein